MDDYTLDEVLEQIDKLIEMVSDHEDVLFGVMDLMHQIRDVVEHATTDSDSDD